MAMKKYGKEQYNAPMEGLKAAGDKVIKGSKSPKKY